MIATPFVQKIQRYRFSIALLLFRQALLKSLTFGFGVGLLWTWSLSFTQNPPSASLHAHYFYYVCLLAFVLAATYTLYWKPSLFRTCRYLDQKEHLHDQLTTAYQVQGNTEVEQIVQQRAHTLFPQKRPVSDPTYLLLASFFLICYLFSPPLQQAIQRQNALSSEESLEKTPSFSSSLQPNESQTPPQNETAPPTTSTDTKTETVTEVRKIPQPLPQDPLEPFQEKQAPNSSESKTEEKKANPEHENCDEKPENCNEKPSENPLNEPSPKESGEESKEKPGEDKTNPPTPETNTPPNSEPEQKEAEKSLSIPSSSKETKEGESPEPPQSSPKKPLGFVKKEVKPLFSDNFFREKTIEDWIQSGQVEVDAEILKVFPGAETLYLQEGFPIYFQDLIRSYWDLLEKDALKRVEKR